MKRQTKLTFTAIALTAALMVTACSKTDEILYEPESTTTTTKAEQPEEATTAETTTADTTTTTTAVEETTTTSAVTTTEATNVVETEPTPQQTESTISISPAVVTTTAITTTTTTTTTTTAATTTTANQPKPTDYTYLNLTQSDIKYILGECQKYAESLGYTAVTYKDFMDKYYWDKPENLPPIYVITDFSGEGIRDWSWNVPIYFGNNDGEIKIYGELQASDTKEHFMEYTISRMCANIKQLWDTGNGNDVMIDCVKLSEFDKINKEKDGWSLRYEDWGDYFHWDTNTSYVFAPCYC